MAEWSPERELELIEMWRQQPVLYDTTHVGYLRRGKKFSVLTFASADILENVGARRNVYKVQSAC